MPYEAMSLPRVSPGADSAAEAEFVARAVRGEAEDLTETVFLKNWEALRRWPLRRKRVRQRGGY